MSQLTNTINTVFRARDGGLIAQLGGYAQGFGTISSRLQDNVRQSETLSAQWRAFATTIRYAIAGQAVFGLTRMLGQLKDINQQLGEMAALTTPGTGGSAWNMQQVQQLGNNLQTVAMNTITPLNQVQDAAINFLSTVQKVPPGNALPRMLQDISKSAQIAQTDLTTLTQAATTTQVQFGRPATPTTLGQFNRMWQRLILQAPGGPQASTAIAQAIPGLATMFMMGRGTQVSAATGQAQMMASLLGVLRTGMPASPAIRGLQYLLQSLENPTGKSVGALKSIGITPEMIQKQGIWAALMVLLRQVTQTGNARVLGQIPDDQIDMLDQSNGNLPGIPASEMKRLRTYVPRIHGIRALIILASQLQQHGTTESLLQDLQGMQAVQDANSTQAKALSKAWDRFFKQSRMAEAVNDLNVMGIQVAQGFSPIFNYAAQHVVSPAAHAMQHHRTLVRDASYGIVGAAGLGFILSRFRGTGIVNRIVGRFSGAAVGAQAIEAAIAHPTGLGASPLNPMYVVVVGQLFGNKSITQALERAGLKTAARDAEKEAENLATKPSMWGRIGNFVKNVAGPVGGGLAVASRYGLRGIKGIPGWAGDLATNPRTYGRLGRGGILAAAYELAFPQDAGSSKDIYNYLARTYGGQNIEGVKYGMLQGVATVWVTLDTTTPGGQKKRKTFHIPVSMAYSGGRTPSTAGKPRTNRSNR